MIIHMLDKKALEDGKARYLCIHAVYPTWNKISMSWNCVTCKNCLRMVGIKE